MSKIYLKKLVESGVHFGHRVSRWNPKMGKYIYGKRNLIHIINLMETVKGLTRSVVFLKNLCATGQQVVFVGTKRQIKSIIESEAGRCVMPYVTERWLGGTLTNFQTIRARLKRLEQLEELESTGKLAQYSKKIQASLMRELRKIKKNLDGIREMHRLPGAMVVVDPKNEIIAVKEANKLGLPVIAILDTDCDPEEVDIPIPGNDDAIRSVQVLLEKLVDAVNEGKANYNEQAAMEARAEIEDQFELASEKRRQQKQKNDRRRQQGQGGKRAPERGGPRGGGGGQYDKRSAAPVDDTADDSEVATPVSDVPKTEKSNASHQDRVVLVQDGPVQDMAGQDVASPAAGAVTETKPEPESDKPSE